MSNVKVNGNTYNGVTGVKLPLADGTGYATYTEGAAVNDVANAILDGSISGDYTNEDIKAINLSCFIGADVGTLHFPSAVAMSGNAEGIVAKNILLPKVSACKTFATAYPSMRACNVSGVIDLSSLPNTTSPMNQTFYGSTIGTLKLGEMPTHNGCLQNATITNLVWNYTKDNTVDPSNTAGVAGKQGLNCIGLKVTNAYITDALYDAVKACIEDGTLTTVTNLYKLSEWSDD